MNNIKLQTKLFFFFFFIFLIIFSSNSFALTWTRTAGTSDHRMLSDLEWSMAGHTIDSNIEMNRNNISNAYTIEGKLIGVNATGSDGIFILTTDEIIGTKNKGIFSTRNGYYDWVIGYIAGFDIGNQNWIETWMFTDGDIGRLTKISEIRNSTYNYKTFYYNDVEVATNFSASVVNAPTVNNYGYFNMFEPDFTTFGGSHCAFQMAGFTGTLQCYNDSTEIEVADFNLYAGNIRMNLANSNVTMNNLTSTDGTFTRLKGTNTAGTNLRYTTAHLVTVNTSNVTIAKGNLVLTQGNATINGRANITQNLNVYGNITGNIYHTGMYTTEENGVTGMQLNATYQPVSFAYSPHNAGFRFQNYSTTYRNSSLQITDTNALGEYRVEWRTEKTGVNNHVYFGVIYVDENAQNNTRDRSVGQVSNALRMLGFGYIRIDNLGANITLRLKDTSGTTTPTVYIKNVVLERVHN